MCRLRFPGGIVNSLPVARPWPTSPSSFGGGYADVTTRANLQIREIGATHAVDLLLDGLHDLGIIIARLRRRQHPQHHRQPDRRHRPAGADRHAAAGPGDAPLHPQPPRAVRPAAQVQHRLRRRRHDRGAGGHQRHRLHRRSACRGPAIEPGVYFRLQLGGITGHKDFARDDRRAARRPRSACRSPPRSCASSSSTATAPTARRPG